MNKSIQIIYILLASYFTYLMVLITLQYIPINLDAAFLALKDDVKYLPYYPLAFYAHVYSSIFVLAFGFLQFLPTIRSSFRKTHIIIGKIYVVLILFVAAPSGLIMGIHGNGGIYAQISFCILSILWSIFTYIAFHKAKKKQFFAHQNFMILSFALTLSAISLRLFKWLIVNTWALPPMDTYRIVVWLGWLFNILIAVLIILYRKNKLQNIPL